MDLLKEIKNYVDEDSRPVSEQLSYIKKLGAMMMLSNRLYKDHVVSFCGTLIKLYNNLNSSSIKVEELKD